MSSGGGTTTTQTQQQSTPWAPIQPYLTDVASQAQALNQAQQGNNVLPNSVAPLSSQTTGALDAAYNYGINGSPVTNSASGSLQSLMHPQGAAPGNGTLSALQGGYADPGQAGTSYWANPNNINPFINAEFSAAAAPVSDAVNSQFEQAGRYGSGANQQELTRNLGQLASSMYAPAYENAAGRALSASGQLSADASNQAGMRYNSANALNQQYNTGNNLMLGADQLAPSFNNMDLANLQAALSSGQAYDTQSNAELQNALQQYMYSQQQPWNLLNAYSGDVTGLGALGGQSSGTSSQTQPKQSLIPGLMGLGASIGMAPMTGGGSLFGMLSDRRAKTDIRRIGKSDSGFPLYTFRYKGETEMRIGLMAQDVEKIRPDAVNTGPDGLMRVDYDRALAA